MMICLSTFVYKIAFFDDLCLNTNHPVISWFFSWMMCYWYRLPRIHTNYPAQGYIEHIDIPLSHAFPLHSRFNLFWLYGMTDVRFAKSRSKHIYVGFMIAVVITTEQIHFRRSERRYCANGWDHAISNLRYYGSVVCINTLLWNARYV